MADGGSDWRDCRGTGPGWGRQATGAGSGRLGLLLALPVLLLSLLRAAASLCHTLHHDALPHLRTKAAELADHG